jgi:hypothetical protein
MALRCREQAPSTISKADSCSAAIDLSAKPCLANCIGVNLLFGVLQREETHAGDIDKISFRWRSEPRLLSKCRRRSDRRSSHEAGCNSRFNSARGAVLRASYPARHHQVLPGIRRGAPRLPPLPSLAVVVKPGSRDVATSDTAGPILLADI